MKITKQQLKQIIKEELAKVMDEDMADYVAAASGKDVSGTADQRMKDRKQAILDKYKAAAEVCESKYIFKFDQTCHSSKMRRFPGQKNSDRNVDQLVDAPTLHNYNL